MRNIIDSIVLYYLECKILFKDYIMTKQSYMYISNNSIILLLLNYFTQKPGRPTEYSKLLYQSWTCCFHKQKKLWLPQRPYCRYNILYYSQIKWILNAHYLMTGNLQTGKSPLCHLKWKYFLKWSRKSWLVKLSLNKILKEYSSWNWVEI